MVAQIGSIAVLASRANDLLAPAPTSLGGSDFHLDAVDNDQAAV